MTPKEQSIETHGAPPPPPPPSSTTTTTDQFESISASPPPDYQSSISNEIDVDDLFDDRTLNFDQTDLTFPTDDLAKLEEQINRPRWTVPVLSNGELIKCLRAALRLAVAKIDTKDELCQRFYRDSIVSSFMKIFCDDAVNAWKYDIQICIYKNALMLIRLCVVKLADDCLPLLEALSFVMNPECRFHLTNTNCASEYQRNSDLEPYGSCQDYRTPIRYWLVDFVNKFGDLGGFDALLARFQSSENKLTLSLVVALLKPWGLAHLYVTPAVIKKYFAPIIDFVPQFLDQVKETDLKFEMKSEAKSDTLSTVLKWLRNLASHLPEQEQICRKIDTFRLKMILRLLQTNSFNGKMHALNELNKLLSSVQAAAFRNPNLRNEDSEALTSEKCMRWIQENQVLDIVLRDCLHQPQYVEKLERLLRFLIKEQGLSRTDLDKIWSASSGKHEAIEKNVHDLLAKLAWDFSPEQLEQLFDCFRESWTKASKKQREKLLELIRRLAEDDKEGHTANKILELLWTFARDEKLPNEITDQALAAHLKILDCNYLLDKDKIKLSWIERIVEEIKNDRHVIVSMKHLREICSLFSDHFYPHNTSRMGGPQNRLAVIDSLERKHEITRVVTENLCRYMDKIRNIRDEGKNILPDEELSTDGRFNHDEQIHERLTFLKYIFREGRLYLTINVVKSIWRSLAEQAVYPNDRQQCFRWFAETVEDVGLEHRADREFFQEHLMKLDPQLLTDVGMTCFDRLFKSVNADLKKFQTKGRTVRLVDNENLVGIEYLWELILHGSDDVAQRGTQLIKEIYTKLSPPSRNDVKRIHESFINDCYQRLNDVYQTIKIIIEQQDERQNLLQQKFNVLTRILFVFREYLSECDLAFHKDRNQLPMFRAFRGRPIILTIRANLGQNRGNDDFEYLCHSNDTWGQVRRWIQSRYSNDYNIMEMYHNNDLIQTIYDNRTLGSIDDQDRIVISVRWIQPSLPGGSSAESSSSESEMNGSVMTTNSSRNVRSHDHLDLTGESALPSVILSTKHEYCQFLIELADLACDHHQTRLRDTIRQILDLIPLDQFATQTFHQCLEAKKTIGEQSTNPSLEKFFCDLSPSQMLYNLKTILIDLNPTSLIKASNVEVLHVFFLNNSGLTYLLENLSRISTWTRCDLPTRKSIYLTTFYILKRLLFVMGLYKLHLPNLSLVDQQCLEQVLHLMQSTPVPNEQNSMSMEQRIAKLLVEHAQSYPIPEHSFLQYKNILELIRLIWCLASNPRQKNFDENFHKDFQTIHRTFNDPNVFPGNEFYDWNDENQLACREGLELFCISIALVSSSVEKLLQEDFFADFLLDLVLYCHYPLIRRTAVDQIFSLTIRASQGNTEILAKYLIDRQCQMLNNHSENFQTFASQSYEFFSLLCRLLSYAFNNRIQPTNLDQQLNEEIQWLKNLQSTTSIDDYLLRGHLNLAKELIQFQTTEKKRFYGIDEGILSRLFEQFLFPASTLLYQIHLTKQQKRNNASNDDDIDPFKEPAPPICQTSITTSAAFDLIVALGTGCLDNLKLIDDYLTNLFYTVPDTSVNEWDFALPIGPRPMRGFVGLKNASATCYMNSVLQQLYMIRPLRNALLSVKIPAEYGDEAEFDEDEIRRESTVVGPIKGPITTTSTENDGKTNEDKSPTHSNTQRTEYHIQILRHIQRIFGHLLDSKLQYYTPRGFWKTFKFGGEPVNLRDQHDAVEFLNTLVESIDEALKTLRLPQFCAQVLGGKFADQKICKDCPHRYSREEDFTLISVDIRHSQNLKESLEQYVIGELLDGPNAYFCEKCDKKVDTVKRTCFKKLPPILAIQLKRFDYDWERETPIKFNDYFEFPRELDMEPYTVQGLAKAEGTPVIDDNTTDESNTVNQSTRYRLVGIIVHMGQANGGHYYSFIQYKDETDPNELSHWYKFDDGEVSDCRMDEDEELRSQCFGGDHTTTAFDQPSLKRQRRWWNAYILFYERITDKPTDPVANSADTLSELSLYDSNQRMPLSVQRSVRKQNIKFLHNRIHLSTEFFTFMKTLVQNNVQHMKKIQTAGSVNAELIDETALTTMQITIKFVFSIGWRAKKALRGPANDWGEVAAQCMRISSRARRFLADELLMRHPNRFQEYFIDCTFQETRATFARMLVNLAVSSRADGEPWVEDSVLNNVIRLIKREPMDNVKLPPQYFIFFITYAAGGPYECKKLIDIQVPMLFISMASDDSPLAASPRTGEAEKLFVILSTLIRCFDVSKRCKSSQPDGAVMPNPYCQFPDGPICVIPEEMIDILYKRTSFLKKLIEEMANEDSVRLLRFLIWENPDVTALILSEIVAYIATHYNYDTRTYNIVIKTMLTVEDSWQEARIMYLCRGISVFPTHPRSARTHIHDHHSSDHVQSLFDVLLKMKSSYPKRLYQFIKLLLEMMNSSQKVCQVLINDLDFKQRWIQAVDWLNEHLDRSYHSVPANYSYYSNQSQISSNDQSQSQTLERTPSTKSTLDLAARLYCEGENDDVASTSDDIDDDEPIESTNPGTNSPTNIQITVHSDTHSPSRQSSTIDSTNMGHSPHHHSRAEKHNRFS